ncbi:MAG: cell wall-active antibiotics response protein [Treponema sp.]|jgi:hypothetical protein|nr:cell wall-active antibiotics response protein [Treponema sp.]
MALEEDTIEKRKNKAIELLSEQYAQNGLSVEEYERLVEYIYKSESPKELSLIESLVNEQVRQHPLSSAQPQQTSSKRSTITILASRETTGIKLHTLQSIITVLGDHTTTISDGDLPPGPTYLDITNILANNTVWVDPGITVRIEAMPILGNVSIDRNVEQRVRVGSPELIVTGITVLGNIVVKVKKKPYH